jgi:hypothetical protein
MIVHSVQEGTVDKTRWPSLGQVIKSPENCEMTCISCGKRVRLGDYCSQCGGALEVERPGVIADKCPGCGGIVDRWALQCRGCDLQVQALMCDICGNWVASEDNFCNMCGVGLVWRTPALTIW